MRVGQAAIGYPQQATYAQASAEVDALERQVEGGLAPAAVQVQNQQFLDGWNRTGQALDAGGTWAWHGAEQVGGAVGHGAEAVGGALWRGVTAVGGALLHGAGALLKGAGSLLAGALHAVAGLVAPKPSPWQPIPGLPYVPGPVAPQPKPVAHPPKPSSGKAKLEKLTPAQLAHLGATDKQAFFAALRPAALEAQQKYGVPAAITLAQAALETGWGQHLAADYNLFGIKGKGPAGSHTVRTREVYNGRSVYVNAAFASYHNFYEAVEAHGQLFHNGYYNRALANYARTGSVAGFARDITGVYATDPSYGTKLMQLIRQYKL